MDQKEFVVDDFVAGAKPLSIEVRDKKGQLIKSAELTVTISGGANQSLKPEDDGAFKISPPHKDVAIVQIELP